MLRAPDPSWKAEGGYESSRVRIQADDSDWFHVDRLMRRSARGSTPKIVVQLHGLESTSTSPLCESMARAFARTAQVDQIHTVCFRGCSGSPNDAAGAYHLGFTADLKLYLRELRAAHPGGADVFLSGFSLGANAVLKALGELGPGAEDLNVRGAAVTCVPFDCEVRERSAAESSGEGSNTTPEASHGLVFCGCFLHSRNTPPLQLASLVAAMPAAARRVRLQQERLLPELSQDSQEEDGGPVREGATGRGAAILD